jgi:signal transduction histidine kinase/CheY-like chemotaxis protein
MVVMTAPRDDRVLEERLRLLYGNVASTVLPTYLLCVLMFVAMTTAATRDGLLGWCIAVVASKTVSWLYARRQLTLPVTQARRRVVTLTLLNAVDGIAWGAISWAVLGKTGLAGSVLAIAIICGSVGSSVSLLSPVIEAFYAFVIFAIGVTAAKVWVLQDPAYHALAVAGVLYVANLIGQARGSSAAAKAAIELRFENIDLLAQLRARTQEAEAANLAKSKFLAAASHDLRQPVHAEGLLLEGLARTDLDENQQAILQSARAASRASAEMLDTLLDFSRIEAGIVEAQLCAVPLQPLLHRLEREFAPEAEDKGLFYRYPETRFVAHADPILVERILRNLIGNAIRYTERGGVLVTCRQRGDCVRIDVWDTGIGIAADEQDAIFREFHQLRNPERDRKKGLGLGLAIADSLAKKLGQRISVRSRPGKGSVFRFALPLCHDAFVDEPFVAPPRRSFEDVHVLVIDDDALVRAGMMRVLTDWGCTCDAVGSIAAALAAARAHRPTVVISDYRLPGDETGRGAVAALRAEFSEMPALLVTGDTAPERLREARASKIPLLHKPLSPSVLRRALEEIVKR